VCVACAPGPARHLHDYTEHVEACEECRCIAAIDNGSGALTPEQWAAMCDEGRRLALVYTGAEQGLAGLN
jgi:hypothetical protein